MEEEKIKQLRNHIPTIKSLCETFLCCLNAKNLEEEAEKAYLLEIIEEIETNVSGARDILEGN